MKGEKRGTYRGVMSTVEGLHLHADKDGFRGTAEGDIRDGENGLGTAINVDQDGTVLLSGGVEGDDLSDGGVLSILEHPDTGSHGSTVGLAIGRGTTAFAGTGLSAEVVTVLGGGDVEVELALAAVTEHEAGGEAVLVVVASGAGRSDVLIGSSVYVEGK